MIGGERLKINKVMLIIAGILTLVTITTISSAQFDYGNYPDAPPAWAFMGLGMLCIFPLIMLIIWIVLAIWVYKDAKKRGSSGALWLLIVLITGSIGLIIWLVVRPPIGGEKKSDSGRTCPNCGRSIPMDAQACPYCAKKFEE
jgi:Na+/H+-dicarboxylate symporter